MTQKVSIEDWHRHHMLAAGAQGWCLSEVGLANTPNYLELQRFDDAESVGQDWGISIPQLDGDDQAAKAFEAAWRRGEDHALLAYQILKFNSPSEFEYWGMDNWHR